MRLSEKLTALFGRPKRKTKNEIIAGLQADLQQAYKDQVYGFFLDGPPTFVQGDQAGEVCELITAADLNKWFPKPTLRCTFCGTKGMSHGLRTPHTTLQHDLWIEERRIKDCCGYDVYYRMQEETNRYAVFADSAVALTVEEALILQRLLKGYVVGPDARKVLDKINTVKEQA